MGPYREVFWVRRLFSKDYIHSANSYYVFMMFLKIYTYVYFHIYSVHILCPPRINS